MKRYRYYSKLPTMGKPNDGPPKEERPWFCEEGDKRWEGPAGVYVPAEPLLTLAKQMRDALDAKDELLACYRVGRQPTEALFARLDKAKATVAAYDKLMEDE